MTTLHQDKRSAPCPHVRPADDAAPILDASPRVSPYTRGQVGFEVRVTFGDVTSAAYIIAEPDAGRAFRLATLLRRDVGRGSYARTITLAREVQEAELAAFGIAPGQVRQVGADPSSGRLRPYGAATDWREALAETADAPEREQG